MQPPIFSTRAGQDFAWTMKRIADALERIADALEEKKQEEGSDDSN